MKIIFLAFLFCSHSSFAAQTDAIQIADQVILNTFAKKPAPKLKWNWEESILLFGLSEYGKDHPSTIMRDRIHQYLADFHARVKIPAINRSDSCPTALSAFLLSKDWNDHRYLNRIVPVVHYLRNEPRNSIGALDHLGHWWLGFFYPQSIWIDSLMMVGVTASEMGAGLNDPELQEFGFAQPLIYADKLLDKNDHMFKHAWLEKSKRVIPEKSHYWLRGNGWALVSFIRTIDLIPTDDPRRAQMIQIVRTVSETIMDYQRANGLWGTLITNSKSYDETSGTALVAYALARGYANGILGPRALASARAVFQGIRPYLVKTKAGLSMRGISGPTNPGSKLNYLLIPRVKDKGYGVGPFLLLSAELSKLHSL